MSEHKADCTSSDGAGGEGEEYPLGFYGPDEMPPKKVYLTFDDGPTEWTNDILDILQENGNIPAAFFMNGCSWTTTGSFAKEHSLPYGLGAFEKELNRMVDEGHIIGNHTLSHPNLAEKTAEEIQKQFDTNQEAVNHVLGEKAPRLTFIRPPFGSPYLSKKADSKDHRVRVSKEISQRGINCMWTASSSDAREWEDGEWFKPEGRGEWCVGIDVHDTKNLAKKAPRKYLKKKERIIEQVRKATKSGDGHIILFHDTHNTTRDALKTIIDELKGKGYGFESLEQLCQWKWGKSSQQLIAG